MWEDKRSHNLFPRQLLDPPSILIITSGISPSPSSFYTLYTVMLPVFLTFLTVTISSWNRTLTLVWLRPFPALFSLCLRVCVCVFRDLHSSLQMNHWTLRSGGACMCSFSSAERCGRRWCTHQLAGRDHPQIPPQREIRSQERCEVNNWRQVSQHSASSSFSTVSSHTLWPLRIQIVFRPLWFTVVRLKRSVPSLL